MIWRLKIGVVFGSRLVHWNDNGHTFLKAHQKAALALDLVLGLVPRYVSLHALPVVMVQRRHAINRTRRLSRAPLPALAASPLLPGIVW